MIDFGLHFKAKGVTSAADYLTKTMSEQKGGKHGGSVTVLRPDGTPFPGSPFKGGGLPGPWAVAADGDDNIWISNFAIPASPIVQLCGAHRELPARLQDWRPDLTCRWLRGRRLANADRYRGQSGGRCLGDEQLAGRRQLLCRTSRGTFNPLRRARSGDLFRHGQARPLATDWPGTRILGRLVKGQVRATWRRVAA
jgi:hypothetical protein